MWPTGHLGGVSVCIQVLAFLCGMDVGAESVALSNHYLAVFY